MRFSRSNSNLHKPMTLIVEHAGLVAWPKLFLNRRAFCETDWLEFASVRVSRVAQAGLEPARLIRDPGF